MTVKQLARNDSGQPDLLGVGQHCSHAECRQLDFLPFRCAGCQQIFCLDHRTAVSHHCSHPAALGGAPPVMVCPVCARAVKFQEGEDPNVTYERHSRTECDPANYAKVHKKPRCPVPLCREKLTAINSFMCKECGATVCLRHRLSSDHACPGGRAAAAAAAAHRFGGFFGATPSSSGGGGAKAAAAATTAPKPTAKAKLAAAARQVGGSLQAQVDEYRASHSQRGRAPAANAAAAAGSGTEVIDLTRSPHAASPGDEHCPQCSARFASVQQLIDHAAAAHEDSWTSGGLAMRPEGGGTGERCPHCSRSFADPVALVEHVERQHQGVRAVAATETCVLC